MNRRSVGSVRNRTVDISGSSGARSHQSAHGVRLTIPNPRVIVVRYLLVLQPLLNDLLVLGQGPSRVSQETRQRCDDIPRVAPPGS